MAEYSRALADAVRAYLDKEGLKYEFDRERGVYSLGLRLSCQLNNCRVFVQIRDDAILCKAFSPINVAENRRAAVAEYLTRANYSMLAGNFEMDYSDGEVSYRNFLKCGSRVPDMDTVEHTVDIPYIILNRYGDGLLAVMYGGKDPALAVEEAESK